MTQAAAFLSATIPQERLLPGIHGLRGIAALAVVLYHVVHLANISPPSSFSFIASDFGKGVHLFFVLSAFSLMHSTEHVMHRPTWVRGYFVKRYFRIAPLFYCMLAVTVLWQSIKEQQYLAVNVPALLLNLTFTFGFAPWSSIVWAGWTVGVEMLFYAVLPVLLLTVRSSKATLALVVISILISSASNSVLQAHFEHTVSVDRYNWAYFSFPPNLCYFVLGMYAFRISRTSAPDAFAMRWGVPVFASLLLALLFSGHYYAWRPDLILWGFGFSALALWQSVWPSRWCANKFFQHVGERSYSLYLLHPVMIFLLKIPLQALYGMLAPIIGSYAYFVCTGVLLVPLLLLSEATYRIIEIPAIRYGQKINRRFCRIDSD